MIVGRSFSDHGTSAGAAQISRQSFELLRKQRGDFFLTLDILNILLNVV